MKQKQHLGVSTHPRVCGFASKNIYKEFENNQEKSDKEEADLKELLKDIPEAG